MQDDDRMSGRQPWSTGRRQASPRSATARGSGYGYRPSGRRGAAVPAALLDDRPHRRFSDLIVPGSVILGGVLAVLAFAMIVNATMRPDERPQALPPAQPPALGGLPLVPSAPTAIPIPNASGSAAVASTPPPGTPSAAPSTTPTVVTPTTTPPTRAPGPTVEPVRDRLSISQGSVPRRVDLSVEGRQDWVHWGEDNTFSLERRKDGGFAILEGTPTAPRFRHALSTERFTWRDGSPVERSAGTPTGIRTCGDGNGFTITAPAAASERRLRLYVGVTKAKGRMEARLSGGGQTVVAALESRSADMRTAVYTVKYRAAASGTVKLSWITEKSFDADCGGVALQAATLN